MLLLENVHSNPGQITKFLLGDFVFSAFFLGVVQNVFELENFSARYVRFQPLKLGLLGFQLL